jgi:hypothetical protein
LHQRVIVNGIQGTFVSLGAAASMIFVPAVLETSGSWQIALAATGLFPFAALAVSLMVVSGPKPPVSVAGKVHPEKLVGNTGDVKRCLMLPATWAAASCGLCFGWAVRMIYDIVPSYLTIDQPVGLGMAQLSAGRIMSGVHVLSIAASLSSGFLLEKCFRGRPRGLVMIGFFGGMVLWLLVRFPGAISHRLALPLCMWMGGFAISLTSPLVQTFISKSYSKGVMGKISGLVTGFSALGTLGGLAAGSYALHMTGVYHAALLLISIGAFTGFLSAFFLKIPEMNSGRKIDVSTTEGEI